LNGLDIPYVTLLDLDRERGGGGWGRIKYVIKELLELGYDRDELLEMTQSDGTKFKISANQIEQMHLRDVTHVKKMQKWIDRFERYSVFFSAPLDLDFLMLRSFPTAYEVVPDDGEGPDIPANNAPDLEAEVKGVVRAVLKKKGSAGSTYTDEEKAAFFWYRYLFLGRGKPTTHVQALADLDNSELAADSPDVLRRLVAAMKEHLVMAETEEAEVEEADDAN
jgi:putative ATP-dependent endonuclease of the OLD family